MTYNINSNNAISIAAAEAGVSRTENASAVMEGGLWCVEFMADELWYCCYVDAETGEVPGLSFAPCSVESYPGVEERAFCEDRAA